MLGTISNFSLYAFVKKDGEQHNFWSSYPDSWRGEGARGRGEASLFQGEFHSVDVRTCTS